MNTIKYKIINTIELQKGDWVRLKSDLLIHKVYGNIVLLDCMVFSGIKQIDYIGFSKTPYGLTTYKINNYWYSKEMLELVDRDSYNEPLLESAMKALEQIEVYNSTIASKEKDAESSSLNLVVNKNKKKIHFNFKQ